MMILVSFGSIGHFSTHSGVRLQLKTTAQNPVSNYPEGTAPRFLLQDRDQIYGEEFRRRVAGMKIEEVITAPHSPWQTPSVERLIGSIWRECLDHVIVLSEKHLRR